MSGAEILFYIAAAVALGSAVACVTRRNPVVAAVWLVASFFCVAVSYILLWATFLSVIQVLVYAGAMMVLFVFVIMVLDVDETGRTAPKGPARVKAFFYYTAIVVGTGFLFWVMVSTLSRQYVTPGAEITQPDFGTANGFGRVLFLDYLFAFEAVSLLLLAAVIGAVVVARSRKEREKEAAASGMGDEALAAAGLAPHDAPHELAFEHGPGPRQDFGQPSGSDHIGGA